jgi:hypothetical protein
MITNGLWSLSKVFCVFLLILFKLQFVLQIFLIISNMKFYKISSNLSRGGPCGQTDRERERERERERGRERESET